MTPTPPDPTAAPSPAAPPRRRSGLRRAAMRAAVSIGTLLVAFVVVDRLYAAFLPIHMFGWFRRVASDDVFYEPVPSVSYEFMGNRYRHNAARMRDASERSPEGDGRPRIAFLGDSVCYGSRVDDAETLSAVAERTLADAAVRTPGARAAECLNFGVPGYNAHQVRHAAEARFSEFRGITDAVYVFSENDLVNACFEPATHRLPWTLYSRYQPPQPGWKFWVKRSAMVSVWRARTSGHHARYVERMERKEAARTPDGAPGAAAGPGGAPQAAPSPSPSQTPPAAYDATTALLRSLLLEPTPLRRRFSGNVGELSSLCAERGIRLLVLYVPSEQSLRLDVRREYADELRRLCESLGAAFADGTEPLAAAAPCHADNGHPDARGHAALGRFVAARLGGR